MASSDSGKPLNKMDQRAQLSKTELQKKCESVDSGMKSSMDNCGDQSLRSDSILEEHDEVIGDLNSNSVRELTMPLTQSTSAGHELNRKFQEVEALKLEIGYVKNICDDLQKEVSSSRKQLDIMRKEEDILKADRDMFLNGLILVKEHLPTSNDQTTVLQEIDKHMEKAGSWSIDKMSELGKVLVPAETFLRRILTLHQENRHLKDNVKMLVGNNLELQRLNENDDAQCNEVKDCQEASEEMREFCTKNESLTKVLIEAENMMASLEEAVSKNNQKVVECDHLKRYVNLLQIKCKELTQQNEDYAVSAIAKKHKTEDMSDSENESIYLKFKRTVFKLNGLEIENAGLQAIIDAFSIDYATLDQDVTKKIEDMRDKLRTKWFQDSCELDDQKFSNLQTENFDLKKELDHLNDENKQLRLKCESLGHLLKESKSRIERTQQMVSEEISCADSSQQDETETLLSEKEAIIDHLFSSNEECHCQIERLQNFIIRSRSPLKDLKSLSESLGFISKQQAAQDDLLTNEQYHDCFSAIKNCLYENEHLREQNTAFSSNLCAMEGKVNQTLFLIEERKKSFPSNIVIGHSDVKTAPSAIEPSQGNDEIIFNMNMIEEEYRRLADTFQEQLSQSSDLRDAGDNICVSCKDLGEKLSKMETKMSQFKSVAAKWRKKLDETGKNYKNASEAELKAKTKLSQLSEELKIMSTSSQQCLQNFQNLQMEYDQLQDECENLKSDNANLNNSSVSTSAELEECKVKIAELEKDANQLKENAVLLSGETFTYKEKIIDLESKIILLISVNTEAEKKIQDVLYDLEKSKSELTNIIKDKEELEKSLDDALREIKQHCLLNLEMADWERTVADLTSRISEKDRDVKQLQIELQAKVSQIQDMDEEIKFCETHRLIEEQRASDFKEALVTCKRELDKEIDIKDELLLCTKKMQSLEFHVEEYKTRLSEKSSEVEQARKLIQSNAQNQERIIRSLNSKISLQENQIGMITEETESVKRDFESYKIRVHSVYKQQKTVSPTPFTETNDNLESEKQKFKLQAKDLSDKLLALTLENDSLHEEHNKLVKRHHKVVEDLESKDQRIEESYAEGCRLQTQIDRISSDCTVRTEMMASSYETKIKAMQDDHREVVEELQRKLDAGAVEIVKLKQKSDVAISNENLTQENREKEESESVEIDGGSTPIKHLSLATVPTSGFLPLEKLVQSSPELLSPSSTVSNQESDKANPSFSKQMQHISEILNESEANNHRLSEQVRVLKDEVRTLQRNEQRCSHSENMEYLKNLFVKFSTLPRGNEKSSLVPVLNTILKLSPKEVEQLKESAGDLHGDSAATWSGYLHRWTGM